MLTEFSNADHGQAAEPHQSAGEGTSLKWSKFLGGLADADGVDR